ncbi:MAG: GH25 family lysozyme [Bacteroidota bacterium]
MKLFAYFLSALAVVLIGIWISAFLNEPFWFDNRKRAEHIIHTNEYTYDSNGLIMPCGNYFCGIDISHHQGNIDWQRLAASPDSVHFVILKATEGVQFIDPQFSYNWIQSGSLGIKRGAYHFFRADRPIEAQTIWYIKNVPLQDNDLPPILDFEQTGSLSNDSVISMIHYWLNNVQRYYKRTPIIYTNKKLYKAFIQTHFSSYPLWLAHYDTLNPTALKFSPDWRIWQMSDRAKINGIGSSVDYNLILRDSSGKALLKSIPMTVKPAESYISASH